MGDLQYADGGFGRHFWRLGACKNPFLHRMDQEIVVYMYLVERKTGGRTIQSPTASPVQSPTESFSVNSGKEVLAWKPSWWRPRCRSGTVQLTVHMAITPRKLDVYIVKEPFLSVSRRWRPSRAPSGEAIDEFPASRLRFPFHFMSSSSRIDNVQSIQSTSSLIHNVRSSRLVPLLFAFFPSAHLSRFAGGKLKPLKAAKKVSLSAVDDLWSAVLICLWAV